MHMKKISIFLAGLGTAILVFDHLARIQEWSFSFTSGESLDILDKSQVFSPDILNGLPVFGFIILAIAAFFGSLSYKKSVFTWAGVVFLVMVVGYFFELLNWPGDKIILALSYGVFIIIVIPWFTAFLMLKPSDTTTKVTVEEKDFQNEEDVNMEGNGDKYNVF